MLRTTTPHPRSLPLRAVAFGVSVLVAVPLGLGAPLAHAATPDARVDASEDPALQRARDLYEQGQACFDTFDYEGAVNRWTEAYAEVPADADWIRNRMVYNIATAQQLAYDVDHDLGHLRQALLLLEQYVEAYQGQHEDGPETQQEIAKAEARIQGLRERIEHAERTEAEPTTDAPDDADAPLTGISGIVWNTPTGAPDPAQLERNQRLAREDRKTDRMLIASTVTLSAGGLITLVGAGAAAGTEGDARGGSYGVLAFGLAGVVTGVTLLGVGLKRRKKARAGTLVTAAPVVTPRFAGASVGMRF